MTTSAIAVSGLRKVYRDEVVLGGIDLDVPAGTVFALLGPTGSGRTTTVDVLTTVVRPDGGTARVAGHDLVTEAGAVRAAIGVTGRFTAVDERRTGQENLQLTADLKGGPDLLERLDLAGVAKKPVSTYSGGMRRKLDLAMALAGKPRILFMDEPTAGLDPRGRHTTWALVRELVADGMTVFLTTQHLDEAEQLADRIAVLDHGRLVAEGTPGELKRGLPGPHIRLRFATAAQFGAGARIFPESTKDSEALALRVPGDGGPHAVRNVLDRLDEYAVSAEELSVHTPDLEEVFLALTPELRKPA
ncbi:ATP-binding cassette domain-containing protein [Amycolatopsis sp. YIM 10]|uniref:ATP-binding cassette domain-containing protein n=1 Tax=Amycolatopsis sp. YIM 10 TaxID=2653857 RepID=UPI0012906DF1|nr:ATP-binding cassette domain-containing protein [Amycolatopsis sp. YIM 10]QFU86835.1 Daunorubicin/doxorubicin resistance ATP-binding protein DrrA [Amycolatopsis sp. YIM 10]